MKIIKAKRIKKGGMDGLEVEIDINGERKIECFDNYEHWMEEIGGERRFIKKIKELHLKTPEEKQIEFEKDQTQSDIITEISEFKNKEIK